MNNSENCAAQRLRFLSRFRGAFFIGVLAFGPVGPAYAKDGGSVDSYQAEYTAGHPGKGEGKADKSDPLRSTPLFAVVSIGDQRISLYGSGGLIVRAPISTGMRGYPTPTGIFSIVQKRRWHESNIYSGAPMPFMQRVTWSGIALHGGALPGYPASHGCIRLQMSFAQRLFDATEIGQRVIIAPSDAAPVEITHNVLPAPKLSPAAGVAVLDAPDATTSANTLQRNDGAVLEPVSLQDAPPGAGRLNPLEFARAMKSEANAKARAASSATRAAILLIARKTSELRLATRKLAGAKDAARDAAGELAAAVRRLENTGGKEEIAEAIEAKGEAEAALAEALRVKEARIAKATEARTQAEAALTEAQKAGEAQIASATEARTRAEATLAETRTSADGVRIAKAAEAKAEAEAALVEALKGKEARIADATEAKSEAEAALTEVEKAGEARIAKATEARNDAEAGLIEAQKAEEARVAKAIEAKGQAETGMIEAQKAAEEALAAKDAKQQELIAAQNAAAEAKMAGAAAVKMLTEATRRLKPLSVFISRKTGRLYVRQNFEPLFDAPVSIRDADREIGTHIYVSTRAAEDGSALYWQAVSMPAAETPRARRDGKGRGGAQDNAPTSAVPAAAAEPETSQGALDRVTIPEEISQRLSELAWVGASVIISDYGISGETGVTTDFIILTKSKASAR